MQDCLFIRHSERSWTSSDVQTGLTVSGQSGQMHSAVSFTTLQPRLYGAEQLMVLHGSEGLAEKVQQHKTRCLKVQRANNNQTLVFTSKKKNSK